MVVATGGRHYDGDGRPTPALSWRGLATRVQGELTVALPVAGASIQVNEIGTRKFTLTVTVDGQRFECGTYISRAAAVQAGRLFADRKEGERAGRQKRPRRKGP
jgi:hypothetical protein